MLWAWCQLVAGSCQMAQLKAQLRAMAAAGGSGMEGEDGGAAAQPQFADAVRAAGGGDEGPLSNKPRSYCCKKSFESLLL